MPTHKIVPYNVKLREKNKTEPKNFWKMDEISLQDPTSPFEDITSLLESFFDDQIPEDEYEEPEKFRNDSDEKSFRIERFNSSENVIEGIIRTGDFGYSAVLRDVDTGETQEKDEREAEELPFHFIFYFPHTKSDTPYDNGERCILVLQTINRRGVKSTLTKRLQKYITKELDNTVLEVNPVFDKAVIQKILDADRIMESEFSFEDLPKAQNDETRYQLMEGIEQQENGSAQIKFKPEYSESLKFWKDKAKEIRRSGGSFAELVDSDVEDIKLKVKNEDGTERKFSILDSKLKMRKSLEFGFSDLDSGLPTPEAISRESRILINNILDEPQNVVSKLDEDTILEEAEDEAEAEDKNLEDGSIEGNASR